ncbi:MAG: glycoside hydrolase family 5 protein [Chitinivibrionales bacterium]
MSGSNFIRSQGSKASGFSRFVLIGLIGLAFFSMGFGAKPAMHGQLQTKVVNGNGYICDQNGNPVQMRGMSMYPWTSAGGYDFYTAGCIAWLYSNWRVHIIRLPELTNGSPPMSYITTVIQACIDSGMYVIVDWHDCTANASAANASAFFKTIATSYHTYPNILYEPWNEPSASGGPSWSGVIKPYMETVIAAIRAIDPNNIVICGNPQWDQLPQNAAADPITDYKNIAYSMHFYSGSHSESGFGPGISTAMSKGCAVFITEYGACNTGTVAAQPQCTQWYTFLDANHIGSTNWGVEWQDACLGTVTSGSSYTGGWSASNLTNNGSFVKAYITAGTDTPIGTEVLPNVSKFQHATVAASNGLLTGTSKISTPVYTINGVRCPVGNKLPNGLYIVQAPGNTSAKVIDVVR